MTTRNLFNDNKRIMGREKTHFNMILWSQDYWEYDFPNPIPTFDNNKKYDPLNSYLPKSTLKLNTYKDNENYFTGLNDTSGKICEIYKGEEGSYPDPGKPHWIGLVHASPRLLWFFKIKNVKIFTIFLRKI